MAIRFEEYERVGVLSVEGDFEGGSTYDVMRTVGEVCRRRPGVRLVIDLTGATFIDSEGLQTLLWARRTCADGGGRLKLAGLDENCRKILEATRLLRQFECHPDLPAALKDAA